MASGRERRVASPERRLRRLLRLPIGLRHVHRVARRAFLPRDRLFGRAHRVGQEHAVQQVLRAREERGAKRERRGGDDPGAVPARRKMVPRTRSISSSAWPRAIDPGCSTTARAGRTSTTIRTSASSANRPRSHPYKDTLFELDDIMGRLIEALRETGQLEDTLIFVSSDNGPHMETWPDAAFTPFRCAKGSTWEGGVRVPGSSVAGHDRSRADRATACSTSTISCRRCSALAGEIGAPARAIATSTASIRSRFLLTPTDCRTASITTTG